MQTTTLDYQDGTMSLSGLLVHDDKPVTKRPGIVLFPDARGIGEHATDCARRLAMLGFVTLVADLYGNGAHAQDMAQAWELMGNLRSDVARRRGRAQAALGALSGEEIVDPAKLAAVGYCFGGTTALELARGGAAVLGDRQFPWRAVQPTAGRCSKYQRQGPHLPRCDGYSGAPCAGGRIRRADEQDQRRLAGLHLWRRDACLHQSGRRFGRDGVSRGSRPTLVECDAGSVRGGLLAADFISTQPDADRCQLDEGEVVGCAFVIAGGVTPTLLDLVEEPLDEITPAIQVRGKD